MQLREPVLGPAASISQFEEVRHDVIDMHQALHKQRNIPRNMEREGILQNVASLLQKVTLEDAMGFHCLSGTCYSVLQHTPRV